MRKQYINFIKFISILFVINIHLLSRSWSATDPNSFNFKLLTFIDILFHVCVPLFIMSSGAIFINRDDSIKKIVFKYMLRIYLIFIVFNVLYKSADIIIYSSNTLSFSIIKKIIIDSLLLKSIYHLWYLKILIAMYLCIPLIRFLKNIDLKYVDHIILILFILFAKVSPMLIKNGHYLSFISVFGFILLYYLGYYLDKYGNKIMLYLFIPLSIISYYYTYHMTIKYSISSGVPTIAYIEYQSYNIMTISIFVFLIVKIFKDIFEKEEIKSKLEFLTRNNFYVYLMHGFIIGAISYFKIIDIYNYKQPLLIIVYGIIVYIITLMLVLPYTLIKEKLKKRS